MPRARQILIAAAAGLSISMLPVQFDGSPFDGGIAFAKNGNNGGGNGGGDGGGGRGGGNGGGKSADNGKSGGNKAAGNGGKSHATAAKSSGKSEGGFLKSLVRGNSGKSAEKSTKTARTRSKGSKKAVELPVTTAAIPAVNPEAKVKNLNARLGSLNSLKRNVNAYMNSNSPGMVAIRAYVMASAESQLAADALAAAQEKLTAANTELALVTPYDGTASLAGSDAITLETRLDALIALETAGTLPTDPVQLQAYWDEREALVPAVQAAKEVAAAQTAADGAVAPDATALDDALIALGNPNLVLDDEIRSWATGVLEGKIAEVADILAAEAAEEEPVVPVTEPVEPDPVPVLPEEEPAPDM